MLRLQLVLHLLEQLQVLLGELVVREAFQSPAIHRLSEALRVHVVLHLVVEPEVYQLLLFVTHVSHTLIVRSLLADNLLFLLSLQPLSPCMDNFHVSVFELRQLFT